LSDCFDGEFFVDKSNGDFERNAIGSLGQVTISHQVVGIEKVIQLGNEISDNLFVSSWLSIVGLFILIVLGLIFFVEGVGIAHLVNSLKIIEDE